MFNILHVLDIRALGKAFKSLGIAEATVEYSGSGDSGCVDTTCYYDIHKNNIPKTALAMLVDLDYSETLCNYIKISCHRFRSEDTLNKVPKKLHETIMACEKDLNFLPELLELDKHNEETLEKELDDLLIDICYAELERRVGGWENNDGGSGLFVLKYLSDNDEITIELEHKEYFTDYNLLEFSNSYRL